MLIMEDVLFRDLGKMEYGPVWDHQEALLQENVQRKITAREQETIADTRHYLLFVEHPPVYTLGKSGHMENVLMDEQTMQENGIRFYRINRGGDITFHGPGQIVGYPILDLEKFYTDIGRYLRELEEVIIRVLAFYGLQGDRSPGETGVWLDPGIKGKERKICAMGVRCSRWITMHGFAFNVNTDLGYFGNIIPCGIQDKQVTSLEKELGRPVSLEEVKAEVLRRFEEVFKVRILEDVPDKTQLMAK